MAKFTDEEKDFLRTTVKDALGDLHTKRQHVGSTRSPWIEKDLAVAESAWEKLKKELGY